MSERTISWTLWASFSFLISFIRPSDSSTFKSRYFPSFNSHNRGVIFGGIKLGLSLKILYFLIWSGTKVDGYSIPYRYMIYLFLGYPLDNPLITRFSSSIDYYTYWQPWQPSFYNNNNVFSRFFSCFGDTDLILLILRFDS